MTDYSASNHAPWYDNRSSITSIIIENGVTSIGSFAFRSCSSLSAVTIPNSVTSIEDDAFYGCSKLTSITCEATTPPTCGYITFNTVPKTIPVYVPAASVAAYKAAVGWKDFGDNIQAIPDTAVDQINADLSTLSVKRFINGQFFIIRDGKTYSVQGAEVQ